MPKNEFEDYEQNDINQKLKTIQSEITALENAQANAEDSEKLVEKVSQYNAISPKIRKIVLFTLLFLVVAFFVSYNVYVSKPEIVRLTITFIGEIFNLGLFKYIFVGFAAQMIDGALGMAYGASCSSFLVGLGVPASTASASIHVAEIFTTGASGLAHLRFGNVNKKLFLYLLFPGVAGAVLGAYLISDVFNEGLIKPFISAYLFILGAVIVKKAWVNVYKKKKIKYLGWLASFGGFMDAIGGGGWGPIVTSSLLNSGRSVSYTIGSVNSAEFFIALSGAGTFLFFTGISGWQAIIGLIIGGILAAPCAAFLVARVNRKPLMILVGVLIMLVSLKNLWSSDFVAVWEFAVKLTGI